MKTILYAILTLCLLPLTGMSQKQNNIWTFGYHLGLDFNSSGGPADYIDSSITQEGAASVCDNSGGLLFYCDGSKAYDRMHKVMPNGSGLLANASTTQGVAIAAVNGSDSLYYIFGLSAYGSKGYLSYSIVDMSLNSGMGDVSSGTKNVYLDSFMSEKMIIAGDCNNQWLITHHRDSGIFYSYNLNSGVAAPVKSYVGYYRKSQFYSIGELKVSPANGRIAMANYGVTTLVPSSIDVFDFDVSTGVVSNLMVLDSAGSNAFYGIEFSPDETKLYAGRLDSTLIYQYDLTLGSAAAIKRDVYRIRLLAGDMPYGMRLGPDDMLYLLLSSLPTNYSRLKAPDLNGALCDFERDFLPLPLPTRRACFGFGNYFLPWQNKTSDTTVVAFEREFCKGDSLILKARKGYPTRAWNDGDTSSEKIIRAGGTYWLTSENDCGIRIDTFKVIEASLDTSYALYKDTMICPSVVFKASVPPGRYDYRWYDGDTTKARVLSIPSLTYLHSVKGCRAFIDTFRIRVRPDDTAYALFKDTVICADGYLDLAGTPGRDSYTWSDGSSGAVKRIYPPATLTLLSSKDCHYFIDTIRVTGHNDTSYHLQKDTAICFGRSVVWSVPPGRTEYSWSDGSSTLTKTATPPSLMVLRSRLRCHIYYDTFRLTLTEPGRFQTRKDTFICNGTMSLLAGRSAADSFLWDNGSKDNDRVITAKGTYWVLSYRGCDLYTDTFRVAEREYEVQDQVRDTNICFSDSARLYAPGGYNLYLWSGGNNGTDTLLRDDAGIILVATDTQACKTLKLQYNAAFINFGVQLPDTFSCNEDSVLLDATVPWPDARYNWSSGQTGAQVRTLATGSLLVHINVKGCVFSDTLELSNRQLGVEIGSDRVVCDDQPVILSTDMKDAVYEWNTGQAGASITVSESGYYKLTVYKDGCSASDELRLSFVNCEHCAAFPNTFTPNNDGINDQFKPILNCPPRSYEFSIYNRWGQEVFRTVNPVDSWNGMYQGLPADGNTYFYMLRISYEGQPGDPKMYKGDIILLR